MNLAISTAGAVMLMGIIVISNAGCNQKSLKSESEGERVSLSESTKRPSPAGENSSAELKSSSLSGESASGEMKLPSVTSEEISSEDTTLPPLSEPSTSSELSGFSPTPLEERIAESEYPEVLTPSDQTVRQRAERTKEDMAAVQAGLQDIFFDFDQWALSEISMEALHHDAAYLHNHPAALLKIEGHCDERGTADYNLVLGNKRAKAARNYLLEMLVKPEQLTIVSYGKERPFCLDRDESCYQQNRRGHMLLSINEEGSQE